MSNRLRRQVTFSVATMLPLVPSSGRTRYLTTRSAPAMPSRDVVSLKYTKSPTCLPIGHGALHRAAPRPSPLISRSSDRDPLRCLSPAKGQAPMVYRSKLRNFGLLKSSCPLGAPLLPLPTKNNLRRCSQTSRRVHPNATLRRTAMTGTEDSTLSWEASAGS